MATFTFFDQFGFDLGAGHHDFTTHQLKIALTNAAPNQATWGVLGDVTQIDGGTGYTTGGVALTGETWEETSAGSGTWRLVTADLTFTASGAGMGPFQYIVLFNDDQTDPVKPLIGYLDYQSAITVTNGNTFLVDVGASGWFQIPIT